MLGVKFFGLIGVLCLKLDVWSVSGVSGIFGVVVKCVDIGKNIGGEGGLLGHG